MITPPPPFFFYLRSSLEVVWMSSIQALRMMDSSYSLTKQQVLKDWNAIFLTPSCQALLKSLGLYVQKLRPWGQKYKAPGSCRSRSRELLLSLALCWRALAVPPDWELSLTDKPSGIDIQKNTITTTNTKKRTKSLAWRSETVRASTSSWSLSESARLLSLAHAVSWLVAPSPPVQGFWKEPKGAQ